MKCLLIQPSGSDRAMMHLGLGYLAAALERGGHRVKILDAGVLGQSERRMARFIEEFSPEVIGITAQTAYYSRAVGVARLAKRLNSACPVVLGGPHPSILADETIKEPAVDFVVVGEGDESVVELVSCLEKGRGLESVRGISYRSNGVVVHNEARPFISDLDSLPLPAWHLFDLDRYRARMNGRRVAPILSSRGCPFKCIFCYRGPAAGKTFRSRSPERIVEEIELLHTQHGIGDILFVDDIFTINRRRAARICDLLIDRDMPVTWRCQTRADCLDLDLLQKMKAAKCIDVSMGVESGNERILASIGKSITKEKIRGAFRMIEQTGVSASASFIIGLPEDTSETVQETIQFARELNPNFAIFYAAMPYPGTELARLVEKRGGKLPRDWSSYRLMSSDVSSSRMLAEMKISHLSEQELKYFLKTAQIEFQMGRLLGAGGARFAGLRNIAQIIRLALVRKKSLSDVGGLVLRVFSGMMLYLRSRFVKRA